MILYGKPVAEKIRKDYVENFSLPKRQRVLTVIADETSDRGYLKAIKNAAVEWDVELQFATTERNAAMTNAMRVVDIREKPCVLRGFYPMDGQSIEAVYGIYQGATAPTTPCTPEAIIKMLDFYGIPIEGRNVVILGRGERVGKPLALQMLARNATVTVCHSQTPADDLLEYVHGANITVCATGKKNLIEWLDVPQNATIVNVGGDYDESTGDKGINLIPFKGGVGCVTAAVLMRHVVM